MNDLTTLLYDLKHKPHCLLPQYASALQDKLEKYLAGELELPELTTEPTAEDSKPLNGVAVIDINGVIVKRIGLPKEVLDFFGLVDLDNVDADLKAVMADDSVTAVVINVTSPGGFLSGVASTAALVAKLSETKETVVYSDVLNASAAYWISSQANTVIVSRDAEVGSVGVYTQVWDYSKALDNEGIKVTLIKAGTFKAIGDPTQPLSDEAKQFLQDDINATWETFKAAVNTKRTIAEADTQGQTFSGPSLLTKGFVDGYADDIAEVISALTENNHAV